MIYSRLLLPLVALVAFLPNSPTARAGIVTPGQKKTPGPEEDPAVIAAKKSRDEADKVLRDAESRNDKKAIAEAKLKKDAAAKALSEARKAAQKAAKEARNNPQKSGR